MKATEALMTSPTPSESVHLIRYTIVALVGMLAGIIVGSVFGNAPRAPQHEETPPVPHPRALEPRP
jgi:hypothetical protein